MVLPDGFLGGSFPCLQLLTLSGIYIPELRTRLSSCRDLVSLRLDTIRRSGFVSPEAMVASLAVLTKLQELQMRSEFWTSDDGGGIRHPDPAMRFILPALTSFTFEGEHEYLEDFVDRIDTPRLDSILIDIAYCILGNPLIPRLSEFIDRSNLKISQFRDAGILFFCNEVTSRYCRVNPGGSESSIWMTSDRSVDLDVAQVLSQTSAMNSNVVRLKINERGERHKGGDCRDNIEWLDLLLPFTAVESLHVSVKFAIMKSIVCAFEEMTTEMAAQVLPALGSLHLEDEPAETIEKLSIIFRKYGRVVTVTGSNITGDDLKDPTSEGSDSEY